MADQGPLVSIITITYNSSNTLIDTLESILLQSYNNIEYIIVDGGSTDDTIKIIGSYGKRIKSRGFVFKFLSEKDQGIADAWNKGLKLAQGKIIGMLNSDDWYDVDAVKRIVGRLDITQSQISYGICKRVNENKDIIEIMDRRFYPNRIYLNFGFSHTTCFMTRIVFEQVGYFDLNYKIAIDSDYLLRCLKAKVQFIRCNNITFMRLGGISTKYEKQALDEYQMALKKNGYNRILIYLFGVIKTLLLIRRRSLSNKL